MDSNTPLAMPPVMDVTPPPVPAAVNPASNSHEKVTASKRPVAADPKDQPGAPRQPKQGVGIAIAATVVIVIALAAMATFAYLKSK